MASPLPQGRLLYREGDRQPFVLVRHGRGDALFLVEDGWTDASPCAGPLEPRDALRAWRIAHVRVPEGCEKGPWQWGIALLHPGALPSPASAWTSFDPAWLPPSVTAYSEPDADGVVNEVCCGAPRDEPRVEWGRAANAWDVAELRREAQRRFPHLRDLERHGLLQREWNAHPMGSPLLVERAATGGRFVVVDLPPPAR